MLSLILTLLCCHRFLLSLSATAKRGDFVEPILSTEGDDGSWGEIQYCDNGTFAIGFSLKVQADRGWFGDDTVANSFRLLCAEIGSGAETEILSPSNGGKWGSWGVSATCPNGSYIIGFKSKVESTESDHTALNSIKAKCNDESSTIIESSGGEWGSWANDFAECGNNSFVCGFKIKVQSDTGWILDDTAMNALELECCSSQTCRGLCSYELIHAENRNIIFVGRSRAGKSTLIEVLKDKNYNPGKMSIFQGTKNATVHPFAMRSDECDTNLHFNIMDTPGLFEQTRKIDEQRTNEVILDIITKCIDLEITKINHVYFVMSLQNGLNKHDIKAFALFTKLFVGVEDKISIILSFTQQVATEEDRQHYIKQFQDHPELKSMYFTAQKRIFFLGAAKTTQFSRIEELRENVSKQRAELFKHIVDETSAFSVKQLKLYKEKIDNFGRDSDL